MLKLVLLFLVFITSNVIAYDNVSYNIYAVGNNGASLVITFIPPVDFNSVQNSENNRVNNYYVPNGVAVSNVVNSINQSSAELQQSLNDLSADYINFGENFSAYLTNMGASLSLSHQSEFINKVLGSTGKVKKNSLVPVLPYLSNVKSNVVGNSLSKNEVSKLNKTRFNASKYISKMVERCKNEGCNSSAYSVYKVGINQLLNQATSNFENASFLESWGEDTAEFKKSLDDLNELFESEGLVDLDEIAKHSKQQKDIEKELSSVMDEWDVEWEIPVDEIDRNDLDEISNDMFQMKLCVERGDCRDLELSNGQGYTKQRKLLDKINRTQKRIETFAGPTIGKSVSSDFLEFSVNSLIYGDENAAGDYRELSNAALDISLGLVPGVSVGKDLYELVRGKSLITGEELTVVDRSLAAVGILTLGGSNYIKAGAKTLKKMLPLAAAGLNKVVDAGAVLVRSARKSPPITTPFGKATQELSKDAISARTKVHNGGYLYRLGKRGSSQTGKDAQFWSLEHPNTPGYADKYGIPEENIINADFIERGKIKDGSSFVTRKAPPVGNNKGGGIEVVTTKNGVEIDSHTSLD
jgi:hypothetical protein